MLLSRVNTCTLLLLTLAIIIVRELATIITYLKSQFDHIERVLLHTAKVTVLAKDGSRISVNLLLVSVSQQTFMTDRLAK